VSGVYLLDPSHNGPVGTTPTQRHRAALTCAERVPRADLRMVLEMLGLAACELEDTA